MAAAIMPRWLRLHVIVMSHAITYTIQQILSICELYYRRTNTTLMFGLASMSAGVVNTLLLPINTAIINIVNNTTAVVCLPCRHRDIGYYASFHVVLPAGDIGRCWIRYCVIMFG